MRRAVALLLVHALTLSSAVASSAHVHEYLGHDHPDHRHGVASHTHGQIHAALPHADDHDSAAHEAAETVSIEACDPGRHAVPALVAFTEVRQVHLDQAVFPGPTIDESPRPVHLALAVADVRAHGPPLDAGIPSRAPPLPRLA